MIPWRGVFRVLTSPPNILSVSRIALSPLAAYGIISNDYSASVCILGYSLLTDMGDGWLSRVTNAETISGSYLDPIADKVTAVTVPSALYISGLFPGPLLGLIISKDVILSSASIASLISKNRINTIPQLQPVMISKINTFFQSIYVMLLLSTGIYDSELLMKFTRNIIEPILYFTSSGTLFSYAALALKGRNH